MWYNASAVASQSLILWFKDAEASILPSDENANAATPSAWPSSVLRNAPFVASQSVTVVSDAEATVLPSGENVIAIIPLE